MGHSRWTLPNKLEWALQEKTAGLRGTLATIRHRALQLLWGKPRLPFYPLRPNFWPPPLDTSPGTPNLSF